MIKKGKIVAVTSSKGGVGKSTIALMLAGMYEKLKIKTLLIDLDLYSGSIAVSLNLSKAKTVYNLVDDIKNNRYKNKNDYITKYSDYIDVLPSPMDPREASKIEPRYVEQILYNYRDDYDLVLIDMTHIFTTVNIITLDRADTILYIMSGSASDIANTKSVMAIFKNTDHNNIKVLLNNSLTSDKSYFSLFDMRNIISTNIDYTLDRSFYINNINKYIIENDFVLNRNIYGSRANYNKIMSIANNLMGGEYHE